MYEEFLKLGKITEHNFSIDLINQLGGEIRQTDKQTDIHKHIDLI